MCWPHFYILGRLSLLATTGDGGRWLFALIQCGHSCAEE